MYSNSVVLNIRGCVLFFNPLSTERITTYMQVIAIPEGD